MARLLGGSALRARLQNLADVPVTFAAEWAEDAADRMRRSAPHASRPESKRFTTKANRSRGGVYGAFWWIFVDRGTKAHDIVARRKKALRFEAHGQTIFAKRTHHRRTRRNPFISRSAQEALASRGSDAIIRSWNGRRIKGPHTRFL